MNAGRIMILTFFLAMSGTWAYSEESPSYMTMIDGLVHYNSAAEYSAPISAAPVVTPVYHRTYFGSEFRPGHSDLTYAPTGCAMYATALPSGGPSFKRALDLPDGAQITRIDSYVIDNDTTNFMTLALYQSTPSVSFGQTLLGSISISSHSTNVQTLTITGTPSAQLIQAPLHTHYDTGM